MTDAAYIFKTESIEKKRTARGVHNMSLMGKGAVKFPSDYLSRREVKRMNGAVISCDMTKPIEWKRFKKLSGDTQREYILRLVDKYDVPKRKIAEMMGVGYSTLKILCDTVGVKTGRGGSHVWDEIGWAKFLRGEEGYEVRKYEPVVKQDIEAESPVSEHAKQDIDNAPDCDVRIDREPETAPASAEAVDLSSLEALVNSLKAAGVKTKITIEINV